MPLIQSIFHKKTSGKFWESSGCNMQDGLPTFSGNMIQFSPKKSCFVFKAFKLQGSILSYINTKGIEKRRYIGYDIFNMENSLGKYEFSFSLRHGILKKVFFCHNFDEFNTWCIEIKKRCLNVTFSEDFDILDKLGKGSTANVYAIKCSNGDDYYACKIFDKKLALKHPKIKAAIDFEAIIMRHLNNPNIAQLKYLYEDEDRIYLIFNLIQGQILRDYLLNHERFKEDEAKIIIKKLLLTLKYLSSRKIIHRDIKLENVMVIKDKHGQIDIKLIDFGFATASDFIDTSYIYGTPGYIAPEMLEGNIYDFKADIFSLGIMLYIMLSGYKPFKAFSREGVLELNQRVELSFNDMIWRYISQDAQDLIKAMIMKDPEQRISYKEALNSAWFYDKDSFDSLPTEPDSDYHDNNDDNENNIICTIEQKIKAKYFAIKPTIFNREQLDVEILLSSDEMISYSNQIQILLPESYSSKQFQQKLFKYYYQNIFEILIFFCNKNYYCTSITKIIIQKNSSI